MGLATALPGLQRGDISTLGSLGALNQAQEQARLDAQREANRMAAFQPQEQLQQYGKAFPCNFAKLRVFILSASLRLETSIVIC